MTPAWLGVAPALLAILFAASAGAAQEVGKRYALIIGVNRFESLNGVQELKYARNDATTLADTLEARGFDEVVPLIDESATRERIVAQLNRLAQVVRPPDLFVLYYAGHGVRFGVINRETYWLTHRARLEALDVEGIRLKHLLDWVKDVPARRKIILLDHCYSGDVERDAPVLADAGRDAVAGGQQYSLKSGAPIRQSIDDSARGAFPASSEADDSEADRGVMVLAAARGSAYERDELKHGIFTYALISALSSRKADGSGNGAGILTARELDDYVMKQVEVLSERAGRKQVPVRHVNVNSFEWEIAQLPAGGDEDVEVAWGRYSSAVSQWRLQGFITPDTLNRTVQALNAWKTSKAGGTPLGNEDQAIVEQLQSLVDRNATVATRVKAETLETLVRAVVSGQPPA